MLYSLIKEHCTPTSHIHITWWMWIWAVGVQCSLINVTYALTFCSNSYDCQKTNNLAPSPFSPSEKQVLPNCSFQNPINSQKTETSRKFNKHVKSNALPPPHPHISWPVNGQWGFFRKRVDDMEFPVVYVEKKSLWKLWGSIKKEVEFPGVFKKKSCGNSMGLAFWPWNFQGVSHNFVEFPGVKTCFFWNF